jgi:hypothetical protein
MLSCICRSRQPVPALTLCLFVLSGCAVCPTHYRAAAIAATESFSASGTTEPASLPVVVGNALQPASNLQPEIASDDEGNPGDPDNIRPAAMH